MELIHCHDRDAPLKGWVPCYRPKPTGCDLWTHNEMSVHPHLNILGQCISLVRLAIDKHGSRARKPLDLDALLLSNSIQRNDDEADATATKQRRCLEYDTLAKRCLGCKEQIFFIEYQMPYSIYLLLTRLERVEMALQACPNDALLHFPRRVSCLLDQTLYSQHTCGVFGIMNKISCVVCGLSSPSSKTRPASHGKYERSMCSITR